MFSYHHLQILIRHSVSEISRIAIKEYANVDFMLRKLDIDSLERQHKLEIEKMELEHKHQLELRSKDAENAMGSELLSTMVGAAMQTPEARQAIGQVFRGQGSGKKCRG